MFLDRTDRSKVSLWWWTVDHKLMGLVILLIIGGIMVLMSAGSPVAIKKGLAEYHFLEKQWGKRSFRYRLSLCFHPGNTHQTFENQFPTSK